MGFFGIVFYIIIIIIFINAKRAGESGGNYSKGTKHPGNYSGQKHISDVPKRVNQSIPNVSKKEDRTMSNVPKRENRTVPNVPKRENRTMPNVPKSGRTITPNVPSKKKREKIFMEPHREEQIQPKIRTNNLWGEDEHAHQRIVALRLMEGDSVPEGYVTIRCPYCAADNLVTKHCKQYHSCYFCRVPID